MQQMQIERLVRVEDEIVQNAAWNFYDEVFQPLNELTPLSQTLDRPRFISWMKSSRAIKFIGRDLAGNIVAIGIVSNDPRHDPLISRAYFKKNYSGMPIYHFPVIAIREEFRGAMGPELLTMMGGEIPPNGIAFFFHSENENPMMPRLICHAFGGRVKRKKLDAMACILLTRSPD